MKKATSNFEEEIALSQKALKTLKDEYKGGDQTDQNGVKEQIDGLTEDFAKFQKHEKEQNLKLKELTDEQLELLKDGLKEQKEQLKELKDELKSGVETNQDKFEEKLMSFKDEIDTSISEFKAEQKLNSEKPKE